MTEETKKGEWKRDLALGVTLAISAGSATMTVIDRTTGSAKSAEQLDNRLVRVEDLVNEHHAMLKGRGRWVNDASNQLNFLCHSTPECRTIYAPINVPD